MYTVHCCLVMSSKFCCCSKVLQVAENGRKNLPHLPLVGRPRSTNIKNSKIRPTYLSHIFTHIVSLTSCFHVTVYWYCSLAACFKIMKKMKFIFQRRAFWITLRNFQNAKCSCFWLSARQVKRYSKPLNLLRNNFMKAIHASLLKNER